MEYEYSFKVSDINEYINYCENNNYVLKSNTRQIRTIYRNNGLIARITQDINKDTITYSLDFKEDKLDNNDLIIRKESKKIIFDNIDNCEDILNFLGYIKDNVLDRMRQVYEQDDVIFEIDSYSKPSKTFVVAIEGAKSKVDIIYKELENFNKNYKV